MEPENDLILEIWEVVKRYCPAKRRDELAGQILRIFEDHGADPVAFEKMLGEDYNLDNAITERSKHRDDEDEIDPYKDEEYFWDDEDI